MTIAGMTMYEMLWYFLIYSFCGWVIEVIYHAVTKGQIINRGFLNGPICPVYGSGMLVVIAGSNLAVERKLLTLTVSEMDARSLLLLFLGSMLFATLVELLAGWLLDVNFHMRWWDYSREPYNFRGYICVRFSIIWGLSISAAILLIHPMMERSSSLGIPQKIGWPLLGLLYVIFAADFVVTVAMINGLNKRLRELDQIQKNMRVVSDKLTQTIGEGSVKASQKIGEGQVQAALARAELRDAAAEVRSAAAGAKETATAGVRGAAAGVRETAAAGMHGAVSSVRKTAAGVRDAAASMKEEQAALLVNKKKEWESKLLELKLEGRRLFTPGRILRKVPQLQHSQYRELVESLKKWLQD